ncbi:MAG: FHA domain-containing protein [Alphaproteobacteria bacterium]|nr:FHA domain-containing protein [Alphaproteobacteria bacterium]
MKAFRIGRSRKNDVIIDHNSVSREHCELVATDEGRYYLTDCNSANGTFRRKKGEWTRIRQEFVAPDEPIRLGEYETTARNLARELPYALRARFIPVGELRAIEAGESGVGQRRTKESGVRQRRTNKAEVVVKPSPQDELPRGKVERDPETGEIVRSEKT